VEAGDIEEAVMDTGRQQRIVVGVSGSRASQAALSWAAGEARLRSAALCVVHVWDPVPHRAPYALASSQSREQQRQTAHDRLADALSGVFGPATPRWVSAEMAEGVAERVLVQRSAGTGLLVIGATTPADQLDPPAGPVVRACLTHAQCPLVIISAAAGPPGITGSGDRQSRVA
jgi:nucleotide-binding universal stress UspA family protein